MSKPSSIAPTRILLLSFFVGALTLALTLSAQAGAASDHGRHRGSISQAIALVTGHREHTTTTESGSTGGGEGHGTGTTTKIGTGGKTETATKTETGSKTGTGTTGGKNELTTLPGSGTVIAPNEMNEANIVHGDEAPSALPFFEGDFDGGFGSWRLLQSIPGRTTIVSQSPYQGSSDARFEVREGDVEPATGSQRAEVTGPTFEEGADIYISDAIRVPNGNTFQGNWQLIQQLHDYGEGYNGSPGMGVFLENPAILRLGPGDGSHTFWTSPHLETERWYMLVYHVKLSRNASVGFAEVWLNGVQQQLTNGQLREYGKTMNTTHTYLKAGIYRSQTSTGTSIVEHDDINVGTSLASVMPAQTIATRSLRKAR